MEPTRVVGDADPYDAECVACDFVGDGLWTSRCIAQDRVVGDADPYEMVFVMSKFKVVYPL